MITKNIGFTACLSALLLSGCSTKWQPSVHYDEFTDRKICRVEKGNESQRGFVKGLTGIYFTQHFYAENNNGEIRAGLRTDPPLPIGGDVQIKVGENLYTLTSQNVPLDVAPDLSSHTESAQAAYGEATATAIQNMTDNIQKFGSPYRAFTGEQAKVLLRDIVNTQGEVKFRVVGVNTVTSGTGRFTVDRDFIISLSKCGIVL